MLVAAYNGHKAIVALKTTSANVDIPDAIGGMTPIDIAAQRGYADAIAVLKAANADVERSDNKPSIDEFTSDLAYTRRYYRQSPKHLESYQDYCFIITQNGLQTVNQRLIPLKIELFIII
jgi:hypothetical protein